MPATKSSSAAAPESLIGQTIGGQYTIQRFLGQGSKAQVFLASHRTLHRNIVLHLLSVPWADDAGAWAKFEEQARTLRGLEHANIAALIDFGRDAGRIFVVTELVEGNNLSDYIGQSGRLVLDQFVPIAAQILKGVGATHARGLVHRDLKPSNVMLVEEQGRANYVKILDLGLAQVLEGPPRDEEPPIVGTPAFLAPEQIMNKPVDARTDVYAIGATFYFLLSGRLPFEGDSAAAVLYKHINDKPTPLTSVLPADHHLPDGLIELVHDCLAKNPDNRPNDANEIVERMIDCVPAAMFRLPIAGVPAKATTGPQRVAPNPLKVSTGPLRAATRPETGPTRAPSGDYRRIPTPPPQPLPPRVDTSSQALAAAVEASGPRPIPQFESSAPTVPVPEDKRGGGGWILILLAVLLTAGLVYVYVQSQATVVQPTKTPDPGKIVNEGLERQLAKARELDQTGKLQEALGAYEAVLTVDPNHTQAKARAAALKAQLANPTDTKTPPDTKIDPVPDTKIDPVPDTKIDPVPDTKTPPDTKTDPQPSGVEFSIDVVGPKKAEVFVDSVTRGKTPLKLDLSPGSHTFEIKAPGWVSHTETIEVAADGQKSLKPTLKRKTGTGTGSGGINAAEENAATNDLEPDKGVETKFEVKPKN